MKPGLPEPRTCSAASAAGRRSGWRTTTFISAVRARGRRVHEHDRPAAIAELDRVDRLAVHVHPALLAAPVDVKPRRAPRGAVRELRRAARAVVPAEPLDRHGGNLAAPPRAAQAGRTPAGA